MIDLLITTPVPNRAGTHSFHGSSPLWLDEHGRKYLQCSDGGYYIVVPNLAAYYINSNTRIVNAIPLNTRYKTKQIEEYYWHDILPFALYVHGREVLHASGIRVPAGVIAFCGNSRAGKSTVAFGLGARGYSVWADDAVTIDNGGGSKDFETFKLPFRIRLRSDTIDYYRSGTTSLPPTDQQVFNDGEISQLKCICVLTPYFKGNSRTERQCILLPPADGFVSVLAHAHWYNPDDLLRKALMVQKYLDISNTIPIYKIIYQHDMDYFESLLDVIERDILKGTLDGQVSTPLQSSLSQFLRP